MPLNTYNLPRHLREPATLIRCKLIISLRFGTKENQKNLRPKNQRGGEIQIRTVGSRHCSALIRLDHYRISSASTGESWTDASGRGGGRQRQCFASLPPTGPEKDGLEQNRLCKRWSHFLRQPAKVDSTMQRTIHHEDAETVFGGVQGQGRT